MSERARAVFITGGGRGLGRAIAERLAAEGARVGVLSRTRSDLDASAGAIREAGGAVQTYAADVLDADAVRGALARFSEWAGGADALVCAAGRLRAVGPLAKADPGEWWRDLETSVRGAAVCLREAFPHLRESPGASATVLVGPGHNSGLAFAAGYGAGQVALVRLVESLAREWAADNVPVYAVNPGFVLTDLTRAVVDSPEGRRWLPEFHEALAEGKEVGPEVAAEMVAWLVENRPPEVNGRVVPAPVTPAILATRLARLRDENRGLLRLR